MQVTADQLNQVAALLGTDDKNVVISVVLKTLVDAGVDVAVAFDMVFGDGAYTRFAGMIYDALRATYATATMGGDPFADWN